MDNLMPPPNGSPEEIEAWNNMMDTMVTFIKASTHLMNTITQKVHPMAGGGPMAFPAQVGNFDTDTGCEPECYMCRPKPPCGICPVKSQRPLIPGDKPPAALPPTSRLVPFSTETPALKGCGVPQEQDGKDQGKKGGPPEMVSRAGVFREEEPPEGEPPEGEPPEGEPPEGEPPEGEPPEGEHPAEAPSEGATPEGATPEGEPPEGEHPEGEPPESEQPEEVAGKEGAEAPGDEEPPSNEVEDSAPPEVEATTPSVPKTPPPPAPEGPPAASSAGDGCVCAAIRAKREAEKKASCCCNPNAEATPQGPAGLCCCAKEELQYQEMPVEPPIETICGCGPTPGNQAAMVQDMVLKLANAQSEILQLQEEMARLQRMDTSRKTAFGGPNSAKLYREIMKGGSEARDGPSQRIGAHVRQRLFQTDTGGESMIERADCPGNRIPAHVRQRLFQTNSSARSDASGLYPIDNSNDFDLSDVSQYMNLPGAANAPWSSGGSCRGGAPFPQQGNATIQPPDDPANRIPDHVRKRLFQTNTTVDSAGSRFGTSANSPASRFGTSGYELSSIPGEGRQLPEGFVGCAPREDGPPSSFGGSLGISPIPMIQVTGASPGPGQQQQQQQQSQFLRVPAPQFGRPRQGTPNRLGQGSQYVGGPSPCSRRAAAGGGSGFGSLASSYQSSPSGAQGGGGSGFKSLASSYQESQGSAGGCGTASGGGSGFRNLPPGYQSLQGTSHGTGLEFSDVTQYGNLPGAANASRSAGPPPARVIMCGPASQQQSSCNTCKNR